MDPYLHACGEGVATIAMAFVHLQICPRETARAEKLGTRHRARVSDEAKPVPKIRRRTT